MAEPTPHIISNETVNPIKNRLENMANSTNPKSNKLLSNKFLEPKNLVIYALVLIVIIFGLITFFSKSNNNNNSSNSTSSSGTGSSLVSGNTTSIAVLSTKSSSSSNATAPLLPKADVYWAKLNSSTPPMYELISTSRPLDSNLKNIDKIDHLLTLLVAGTDTTESTSGIVPTFTLSGASIGDCAVSGANLEYSVVSGKLKIRFCKDIVETMEDEGYAGISLAAQHRVLSAIDKTIIHYLEAENLKLEVRTKNKKCYGLDADASGEINVCSDNVSTVTTVPDCTVGFDDSLLSDVNTKYSIKYSFPKFKLPDTAAFNQVNVVLSPAMRFDQTKTQYISDTSKANTAMYTDEIKYTIKFNCKKILSVLYNGSAFTGGAHPNAYNFTYNFNLNTGAIIHVEDLFTSYSLASLQTAVYNKLKAQYASDLIITDSSKLTYTMLQGYYLDNAGVHFVFDPYVVASYATGTIDIVVDTTSLKYSPLLDCLLGTSTTICGN